MIYEAKSQDKESLIVAKSIKVKFVSHLYVIDQHSKIMLGSKA
jgi:hypothetical protein